MSAYALIIGLTHEAEERVVISGPEVPVDQQRQKFKNDFMPLRVHSKFCRVELLDSRRGVRKRKSFITPKEAKRREKAEAAQDKQIEESTGTVENHDDPDPTDESSSAEQI